MLKKRIEPMIMQIEVVMNSRGGHEAYDHNAWDGIEGVTVTVIHMRINMAFEKRAMNAKMYSIGKRK